MKKYSAQQKLILLITCAFIGLSAGMFAYVYFESQLTQWQREQKIDLEAQTGSTKFEALVNSVSIGGSVFCISALLIIFANKAMNGRKAKK